MIIPLLIQLTSQSLRYSYSYPLQQKTKNELKAERNFIPFRKRIKFLKEGKTPYYYPSLSRFQFCKSDEKANCMFPKHLYKKINWFQKWIYIIFGKSFFI